jgi:drug/metabolite transporter (DMT)-like permease
MTMIHKGGRVKDGKMKEAKGTPSWAIMLIVICTFFAAAGQYFIKVGMNQMALPITLMGLINFSLIFGFFLYAIGAVLMIIALRAGSLSVLYPIISLGFIWVALIGVNLLGETLTAINWVGIASIIFGCSFIGLSERYR